MQTIIKRLMKLGQSSNLTIEQQVELGEITRILGQLKIMVVVVYDEDGLDSFTASPLEIPVLHVRSDYVEDDFFIGDDYATERVRSLAGQEKMRKSYAEHHARILQIDWSGDEDDES